MTDLEARIAAWAAGEENVRASALVGSRARADVPADEWSDFDIVLFARDPAALLVRDDWVATFGRPRLTFLEPTAVGEQLERRVLYEDGTDVDFAIVPIELLDHPAVAHVASRGIRVNGIAPALMLRSSGQSEENYRAMHCRNPLGRGVEPGDVVEAIRYLVGARCVTGQLLVIDSGHRFLGLERDVQFLGES